MIPLTLSLAVIVWVVDLVRTSCDGALFRGSDGVLRCGVRCWTVFHVGGVGRLCWVELAVLPAPKMGGL